MPCAPEAPCLCGATSLAPVRCYHAPPPGETRSPLAGYHREIWQCSTCGHYMNRHSLDMDAYYAGAYVDAAYGARMRTTFERIVGLPTAQSDNAGRVDRVLALAHAHFGAPPTVLDVGSGLCVFLHRLRQKVDWSCMALDPDVRAVEHAREVAQVAAVQADFLRDDLHNILQEQHFPTQMSVITFNRVLEHVAQPTAMLKKARNLLKNNGRVYVELPDGECAAREPDGLDREEFHLEHWHIFSMASACIMVNQAGLTVHQAGRLREPSGKYTLWLWAGSKGADAAQH